MNSLLHVSQLKEKAKKNTPSPDYIDIHIVTLRAYCREVIYDMAFNQAAGDIDKVYEIARDIMKAGSVGVKEFVEVSNNKIIIAINVDKITSQTENDALMLLTEVDNIEEGVKQEFGDIVTFSFNDLYDIDDEIKYH